MEQIVWHENEQMHFEKWLVFEKKEWERIGYHGYKTVLLGLEEEKTKSKWSQEMYRCFLPYIHIFSCVYTYIFQEAESKCYIMEAECDSITFRLMVTFDREAISSQLLFKPKENRYYWRINDCLSLKGKQKRTFKRGFDQVLMIYEQLKEFVAREPSNRLILLTEEFIVNEGRIQEMKEIFETF